MREVEVVGVRIERSTREPLVLLRERESAGEAPRYIPIWIGAVEASAIAMAQEGEISPRPLTHELLQRVIAALGDELVAVRIVDVRDGVFYAALEFASGALVDARPSDSIVLALRTGVLISCAEDVLAAAAINNEFNEDPVLATDDGTVAIDDAQVQQFREFLDHIDPDDFAR